MRACTAQLIQRCLDSARSLISHWVIVDTGSTEGTQGVIRNYQRATNALPERMKAAHAASRLCRIKKM